MISKSIFPPSRTLAVAIKECDSYYQYNHSQPCENPHGDKNGGGHVKRCAREASHVLVAFINGEGYVGDPAKADEMRRLHLCVSRFFRALSRNRDKHPKNCVQKSRLRRRKSNQKKWNWRATDRLNQPGKRNTRKKHHKNRSRP